MSELKAFGVRAKIDAALSGTLHEHGLSRIDSPGRRLVTALFKVLDADSETLEKLLERFQSGDYRADAHHGRQGVNALIEAGMTGVLHALHNATDDREVFGVPEVDERVPVWRNADERFKFGDGVANVVRRNLAAVLGDLGQLVRGGQVFGVTHESSPSAGESGDASVGDGRAAGVTEDAPADAAPLKLAAVIWQDRHSDTTVSLFADAEKAIEWAKSQAHQFDRFGDYAEHQVEGWLYYATYSCEGDGIRVQEVTVDAAISP